MQVLVLVLVAWLCASCRSVEIFLKIRSAAYCTIICWIPGECILIFSFFITSDDDDSNSVSP